MYPLLGSYICFWWYFSIFIFGGSDKSHIFSPLAYALPLYSLTKTQEKSLKSSIDSPHRGGAYSVGEVEKISRFQEKTCKLCGVKRVSFLGVFFWGIRSVPIQSYRFVDKPNREDFIGQE